MLIYQRVSANQKKGGAKSSDWSDTIIGLKGKCAWSHASE